MPVHLVIADGGVASLLACAVAGQRAATGPTGILALCLLPSEPDSDPRSIAAVAHANMFGLATDSLQNPIGDNAGRGGQELRLLLEAGLVASARGGGEVVWPVTVPEANGQPDVSAIANVMNRSLLMSQLLTLTLGGPMVHVRAPYADLTDRQIADLVLDMDLPIWTCWWMAASEHASGPLRERAILERTLWVRVLKEAGWSGSLEAKAVVRPVTGRQTGTAKGLGDKT